MEHARNTHLIAIKLEIAAITQSWKNHCSTSSGEIFHTREFQTWFDLLLFVFVVAVVIVGNSHA